MKNIIKGGKNMKAQKKKSFKWNYKKCFKNISILFIYIYSITIMINIFIDIFKNMTIIEFLNY